jgi:predicted GNAT family acetyltransferase
LLGAVDSAEQRARSASFLDAQLNDGVAWVAAVHGAAVSLSAFNCGLPDIVQLGGIYTPPEQRRRGDARCAVAGSLLAAIERGATPAVLFTQNPNAARCYGSLGFEPIGEYGLVLLT